MKNYKQIIFDALENVVSEPSDKNMHEVALCHRPAVHLENSGKFTGYLIDCDYNRAEQEIKRNLECKIFRTDIIIHIRGNDKNNLIMIEAKKYPCSPEEQAAEKERLRCHAHEREYTCAFLVVFPQNDVKNCSVIEVSREQ